MTIDAMGCQKEIAAQIRQLIERHRIARAGGDVSYQFTDEKRIKKLYVTAAQQSQLANGQIAIVRLGDGYELVPTVVAEKIRQRDEAVIALLNVRKPVEQGEEDDPYAAYQIPDDLMW